MLFRLSSSLNPSTTMVPTPRSIASDSSWALLLFPWKYMFLVWNPALAATATSPPETTSKHSPSSEAICAIARLRNAFEA